MLQRFLLTVVCCLLTGSIGLAQVGVDFRAAAEATRGATIAAIVGPEVADPPAAYPPWMQNRGWGLQGFRLDDDRLLVAETPRHGGFAVGPDLVISCNVSSDEIQIVASDGSTHDGTVVVRDHVTGLAAIRVTDATFSPIAISTETPAVGSPVLINWLHRAEAVTSEAAMIASQPTSVYSELGFVQMLDAVPAADKLGAPVFDSEATLVGVMVVREGTAICLPAEHVTRLIEAASTDQPANLHRGRIGVTLDRSHGSEIMQVTENTPAMEAGLAAGDAIKTIHGFACARHTDVMAAVSMARAGDDVKITVQRGNETLEKSLTLAKVDGEPNQTSLFRPPLPPLVPGQRLQPGQPLFRLDKNRRLDPINKPPADNVVPPSEDDPLLDTQQVQRSELEKAIKKLEAEKQRQDEMITRLREQVAEMESKSGENINKRLEEDIARLEKMLKEMKQRLPGETRDPNNPAPE